MIQCRGGVPLRGQRPQEPPVNRVHSFRRKANLIMVGMKTSAASCVQPSGRRMFWHSQSVHTRYSSGIVSSGRSR